MLEKITEYIPREIIPIIIPVILLTVFYLFSKKLSGYKNEIKEIEQKKQEFEKRSFWSPEEKGRAKEQFKQELLLRIQSKNLPNQFKNILENMINEI